MGSFMGVVGETMQIMAVVIMTVWLNDFIQRLVWKEISTLDASRNKMTKLHNIME